ncbi:hypothetical protein BC827DRAFT_595670 [Russula dissimulans]|nr:hypothetical protein BC827DRAFT_595670 [Russula dissimulans]
MKPWKPVEANQCFRPRLAWFSHGQRLQPRASRACLEHKGEGGINDSEQMGGVSSAWRPGRRQLRICFVLLQAREAVTGHSANLIALWRARTGSSLHGPRTGRPMSCCSLRPPGSFRIEGARGLAFTYHPHRGCRSMQRWRRDVRKGGGQGFSTTSSGDP